MHSVRGAGCNGDNAVVSASLLRGHDGRVDGNRMASWSHHDNGYRLIAVAGRTLFVIHAQQWLAAVALRVLLDGIGSGIGPASASGIPVNDSD